VLNSIFKKIEFMLVACNMNIINAKNCVCNRILKVSYKNSSKFKLEEFKMDENFTQLIFKLVKFKSRNIINYTLKHEG
jgi:hypothetical protein